MKVLVTFALENEFAPWRKMAGFRCASELGSHRWHEAQIGAAEVRAVVTGMGRFAAQQAMNSAFDEIPDFCIASGLAGALKTDYQPGQVLAARCVIEAESGRSLPGDSELLQLAADNGAKLVERFLVTERVIATAAEKQQLAVCGDAVEMEGAYILAAAAQRGVRAVAIRSVSDAVDRDLPLDFDGIFDHDGRVKISSLFRQVAAKPGRIGGLIRLAEDSARAAGSLANFLTTFVRALPANPQGVAKADAIAL